MSQTKRKVKIRQHIAQLHIKTQAVNCPNFKRKKAEPRKPCFVKDCSKDCKKCDGIQDEKCIYVIFAKNREKPSSSSPYMPFPIEPSKPETKTRIVILGSCKYAPYEVLLVPNPFDKKLYVEDHEKAYVEACKRFYPAINNADVVFVYAPDGIGEHTKRDLDYAKSCGKLIVRVSEAEHTKLQEAHKKSVQKLGEITGMYIRKNEVLEGENAKLKNEIAEERTGNEFLNTENLALMGDCVAYQKRLEAIKEAVEFMVLGRIPEQEDTEYDEGYSKGYYDAKDQIKDRLREFGVLLSEPKNEKFRCDKFGDCNMSDACQQCPSNEECSRETRERGERMKRVKIFCHLCEGKGTIPEKAYPNGKEIQCICPECNGEKWVRSDK